MRRQGEFRDIQKHRRFCLSVDQHRLRGRESAQPCIKILNAFRVGIAKGLARNRLHDSNEISDAMLELLRNQFAPNACTLSQCKRCSEPSIFGHQVDQMLWFKLR